jgi:hypothetical protein
MLPRAKPRGWLLGLSGYGAIWLLGRYAPNLPHPASCLNGSKPRSIRRRSRTTISALAVIP